MERVSDMKVAVCDDEMVIRKQIAELVAGIDGNNEVYEFDSGQELLAFSGQMDILFLDIQMEGLNGIDAARELRLRRGNQKLPIIFITGSKEYIFDAFDVEAFQYLLKPLSEKRFMEVFQKAGQKVLEQQENGREKVILQTKKKTYTLEKSKVIYAENARKKIEIYTSDEVIEIYSSMRDLENSLGEGFFRCHRGYLVNLKHITGYSVDTIELDNGGRIYLAKDRYREFVSVYMEFLKKEAVGNE